jgi:hypothetical protein
MEDKYYISTNKIFHKFYVKFSKTKTENILEFTYEHGGSHMLITPLEKYNINMWISSYHLKSISKKAYEKGLRLISLQLI